MMSNPWVNRALRIKPQGRLPQTLNAHFIAESSIRKKWCDFRFGRRAAG